MIGVSRNFSDYSRSDLIKALRDYESAMAIESDEQKRLRYDLPIHQVELEIQNRDLLETQAALEDARDRYSNLYDLVPVGYLSLDKVGQIVQLNLKACEIIG